MTEPASATPQSWTAADVTFRVGAMESDVLKVVAFQGSEALSELFRFQVELCSDAADISFADVVGKPCCLTIAGPSGTRLVNGIVNSFERTGDGTSVTYYAAQVVPLHWLLTQRHTSRAYQEHNCSDMTVAGIVKQVFQNAGIPDDCFRFALQATYETREFVVQYRESDMDFIVRLLEHEGIFYFFEHADNGHKLVFGDAPSAHVANALGAEFPFRAVSGLVPDARREFVYGLRERRGFAIVRTYADEGKSGLRIEGRGAPAPRRYVCSTPNPRNDSPRPSLGIKVSVSRASVDGRLSNEDIQLRFRIILPI